MTDQNAFADKVQKIAADMRAAMRRDDSTYPDGEFLADMSRYIRDLEALTPAPSLPTRWTLYWMTGDRQVVEGPDIATAMNCAGYGAGALAALDFYAKGDGDHGYRWSDADRDWVKKDDPDLFG